MCTAPRDSPGHSLGRETLNFPFRSLALVHEPPAAVPVAAEAAEQQRQQRSEREPPAQEEPLLAEPPTQELVSPPEAPMVYGEVD